MQTGNMLSGALLPSVHTAGAAVENVGTGSGVVVVVAAGCCGATGGVSRDTATGRTGVVAVGTDGPAIVVGCGVGRDISPAASPVPCARCMMGTAAVNGLSVFGVCGTVSAVEGSNIFAFSARMRAASDANGGSAATGGDAAATERVWEPCAASLLTGTPGALGRRRGVSAGGAGEIGTRPGPCMVRPPAGDACASPDG